VGDRFEPPSLRCRRRDSASLFFRGVVTLVALLVVPAAGHATSLHARPPSTQFDALLVTKADATDLLLGTQHGLYRTTNGGLTWTRSGFVGEQVTILAQGGPAIFAGGNGLLAVSTDGGTTWTRLHPRGLPNEQVVSLAVDPAHPAVMYLVLKSGGLYRSTDGARAFGLVSRQVGPGIRSLPVGPGGILAGDVVNGIYLSAKGRIWRRTAGGMVMALAVDPARRSRILVATFGISRSSDGGRRWTSVLRSRAMFGAVAWAPSQPLLAYAVGDDGSLWRSTDGGTRWTDLTRDRARRITVAGYTSRR
jgi:photosystem II stability/assembly factor-like uncharacterized protein